MKIFDAIYESNELYQDESLIESFLCEDKMVKYDGELAPKFGWCVIYVGGPGSGKGSATKFKSRLQGRYYNVDDLKELERMWDIKPTSGEKSLPSKPGDLPGMRYRSEDGSTHRDNLETTSQIVPKLNPDGTQAMRKVPVKWENSIVPKLDDEGNPIYTEEPIFYDKYRNMRNSPFVSELHMEMKPLSKKWQKSIINNPEDENNQRVDRLPNLIFDVTGDELKKLIDIIDPLKAKGYKIAIIWVLSTIERAMMNNSSRPREVDVDTVFLPKHKDVIDAQEALFNTGYIENIDEFWVIDAATGVNPSTEMHKYSRQQNVYHIPCNSDGLKAFDNIIDRIEYNKAELQRQYEKRANLPQ